MAPLNAAAALAAPADVDVEPPVDGLARDLDLVLLGEVGFVERAAAVGAGVGQGRLMNFVDLLGAGRLAMGLGAVVLAGLAAGLLGLVSGLALGEGGGLALAGALRLLQLALQAFDLGFKLGDTVPQVGDEVVAVAAARASGGSHTFIIDRGRPEHYRPGQARERKRC